MEQCESRDNFDRYVLSIDSSRGGSSGRGASQTNQSQLKSSPDSKRATKFSKREVDEDDWSD